MTNPSLAGHLLRVMLCRSSEASSIKQQLQKLMEEVNEVADEDLCMLESSSEVVIGMRIIQQFVIDLLGRNTPGAIIFQTKTEAE